ncbi:MAG: hypothetical protein GKR91_06490 [Pseudomonadales bacterium]|nr:hypothetical protein [Pseudomonadales bacterium]
MKKYLTMLTFVLAVPVTAQQLPEVFSDGDDIVLDIPYFEFESEGDTSAFGVVLRSPANANPISFTIDGPSLQELTVVDPNVPAGCEENPDATLELEDAYLYIENNDTDEDTGVHGFFDGDGYSVLCVFDPNGNLILEERPQNNLGDLGISGVFFESVEPENDEYSIDDLKSDFPEGQYKVRGLDPEGEAFTAEATFTHDIPEAPEITSPAGLVEDEEEEEPPEVDPSNVVISWEAVTETIDGDPIVVTSYEVIVTNDEIDDDPNGFSRPIYDVHLPPDRTSLTVPEEFFTAETLYEVEVLVLELSGNQTIGLGFFQTP